MSKRLVSLILAVAIAVAIFVPAALAEDNTLPSTAGHYYVYTENGKVLNVRETPGGTVVGALKYGSRIYCYYNDNGWALIDFTYDKPGYGKGTYVCFVSSRFLVKNKPAPYKGGTSEKSAGTSTGDTLEDINVEFRASKTVTPYTVYARPTRVSGWVNLRWAPSKSAEVMATYKANQPLLVIAELKNWYQVEDPETGAVGFMDKSFVTR